MGWCPVCRFEYEDWVTVCPNCRAELVKERPPAERRVGTRKATRLGAAVRAVAVAFGPGWRVGRSAAGVLRRNPRFVLVVWLLGTLLFANSLVAGWFTSARIRRSLATSGQEHKWRQWDIQRLRVTASFGLDVVPVYVIDGFVSPLGGTTLYPAVAHWIAPMLWSRPPGWGAAQTALRGFAAWLPDTAVQMLIVVALLAWLADLARGQAPRRLRDYLKAYYLPIIVLKVCVGGVAILFSSAISTLRNPLLLPSALTAYAYSWVVILASLLLALAPFAIVGRNLGAWGGVRAGVSLLWRHRLTLLGLFILFLLAKQVLSFVHDALLSLSYLYSPWGLFEWRFTLPHWLLWLALALLGLWLAAAFTLVVRGDEVTAGQEQAPALPAVPAP